MSRTLLKNSYYRPAAGGHAPGDLRDAFVEAVDAFQQWEDGEPEPSVAMRARHHDGRNVPISDVCGVLWNCSDILPSGLRTQLEDLRGWPIDPMRNTYGAAARRLKSLIVDARA